MDIVRSLQLESFILTKWTKPSVPVNLVGPQVSLPQRWVPASRGSIHFFLLNKESLPVVRANSGGNFFREIRWPVRWVPAVRGKRFFRKIRWPVQWVPAVSWRNHYFPHNKEALAATVDPAETLHVQYASDGSRSLTTLTSPRSVACMRPWPWCVPTVSLSHTVICR